MQKKQQLVMSSGNHRAYQPIKPAASRMLAKRWDDSSYGLHRKKVTTNFCLFVYMSVFVCLCVCVFVCLCLSLSFSLSLSVCRFRPPPH